MAISFISSVACTGPQGSTTSVSTHAIGDLILVFAFRDDGVDPGTAGGQGYTSLATGGFGTFRWRIGYKYATSTSELVGSWANSALLIAHVYRGAAPSPTTKLDEEGSSSGSFIYEPLSGLVSDAWAVAFAGSENNDNTGIGTAPAGMTNRRNLNGGGRRVGSHDTNGPVSSFAGGTVAKGGTNGAWRTVVYEIVPLITGDATYTEADDGYSTSLARNKEATVTYTEALDTLTGAAVQERFATSTYTEALDGYAASIQNGRYANVSYTETVDTVTSAVDLLLNGTVAYTESNDTVTSASSIFIAGQVSYTELLDTVTGLVNKERAGLVSYTEQADTLTGVAYLTISGTAAYTEALDTVASASKLDLAAAVTYTEILDGVIGSLDGGVVADVAYTEALDTLTSSALNQRNGDVSYTEELDGWAGTVDSGLVATVVYTEAMDALSAGMLHGVEATVSYTEILDGYAAELATGLNADVSYTEEMDGYTTDVDTGLSITVVYTEQSDTLSGAVEKGRIASAAYTEALDGYTTSLLHGVGASVVYTEQNDTLSAHLSDNISAEVIYTEELDGYVTSVIVGRSATVVYTEAVDTLTANATKEMGLNVAYSERPDTLSGFIEKEFFGSVVYTEAADTLTGHLGSEIKAHVSYVESNDILISGPVADPRECCPPRLCEITPSALVCNYVNLLPSGPLWDRAKQRVIEHYVSCAGDPAPPPCPVNPDTCSSVVTHAVYTGLRLYDVLQNGLWPALRESDPNTAFTTLDDWLARYEWVDCFYGTCRDPDLGPLTPLEFRDTCYTYFCEPNTPEDLQTAVKHGIVVALSRLNFGIMSRVDEINWVIEPLGAKLRLPANSTDCPISFEIVPLSEYLPSWEVMTCHGQSSSPVQAWFDPNGCYNSGLPSKIWPGLMAAECIARSVMQRNQGIKINRIAC